MVTRRKLAETWRKAYGESFPQNYSGVYRKLPNSFTVAKLSSIWKDSYGESFRSNYSGVLRILKKKRRK